ERLTVRYMYGGPTVFSVYGYVTGTSPQPSVTLSGITVSGGTASGVGVFDGVFLTIEYAVITGNSSGGTGGGINCHRGANLTVRNSTISGNTAGTLSTATFRGGGGISMTASSAVGTRADRSANL